MDATELIKQSMKLLPLIEAKTSTDLATFDQAMQPLVNVIPELKLMMEQVKTKIFAKENILSTDESSAIVLYLLPWIPQQNSFSAHLYRIIQSNDNASITPWLLYLKLFHQALTKLPPLTKRIFYHLTYESFSTTQFRLGTVHLCGFLPCSSLQDLTSDDDTTQSQKTMFIIHTSQGKDISRYSLNPNTKNQILLPLDQCYEVTSTPLPSKALQIIVLKPTDQTPTPTVLVDRMKDFLQLKLKKYEQNCEVNLRGKNVIDAHMSLIAEYAMNKKQCRWLSLQYNQITSVGLRTLINCSPDEADLESLHLTSNYIDDLHIEHWSKQLFRKCPYLTFLSLDYNSIGDQGAEALANVLAKNRTLTDLWLSANRIGNQGVEALAEVLTYENKTLVQLYLHCNPLITDQCLDSLQSMLTNNKSLNTLYLFNCSLSIDGKRQLEEYVKERKDFDIDV